jgi:F-type H+-transporting ATPase subunit delta
MADEKEFGTVRADLAVFVDLLSRSGDLRRALETPFVAGEKRAALLGAVLERLGAAEKTRRFLALLQEHKRLDILKDIAAALPETWNESHGIVTFEVTSAVPLTGEQRERLERELEASEKKPVSLTFKIDPGIVGGLALRKGHIVFDASIQGNLDRMKAQIQQG